jgi:hypothetical protein
MNIDRMVKNIVREVLINEGRKRKETLDDHVDGERLFDMVTDIHPTIKELARPIYGVRQQKGNLDKLSNLYRKNYKYFVKVANKFNKIKMSEGSGPFEIDDITRLIYQYCAYIIRSCNNPNNQLAGADDFLTFYPEEVKEWDDSKKQEIEEYAKTKGSSSSNFFKSLIFYKDMTLMDIMSNIDFILELLDKYGLSLLNLSMSW